MRGTLKVDHKNKKIIMNATFEKYSMICNSDEFAYLMNIKAAFSNYKVITQKVKSKSDPKKYKGLNYDFMKWYIKGNSSDEVARENIAKIDAAKALSTRQDGTYGKVKSWFLEIHKELTDAETLKKALKLYTESVWASVAENNKDPKDRVTEVKEFAVTDQTSVENLLGKAG